MLLAFFFTYFGFFGIALTMQRQRQQLLSQAPEFAVRYAAVFRMVGWLALTLGLVLSIQVKGLGVGITLWVGLLTAAGLAIALLGQYAPKVAQIALPVTFVAALIF